MYYQSTKGVEWLMVITIKYSQMQSCLLFNDWQNWQFITLKMETVSKNWKKYTPIMLLEWFLIQLYRSVIIYHKKINKAYSMIGIIKRNFIHMEQNTFILRYYIKLWFVCMLNMQILYGIHIKRWYTGCGKKSNPLPCFVNISTKNWNFYKKICAATVSYTHLTLPTNREV